MTRATRSTIAKHNKKVAKANNKFKTETPAQQRVTIAKDVLRWLRLGKLKAKSSTWLSAPALTRAADAAESRDSRRELQTFLPKLKTCNACALGSLFACVVRRADKFKLADVPGIGWSEISEYLESYFDFRQLVSIEAAFELRAPRKGNDTADHESTYTMSEGRSNDIPGLHEWVRKHERKSAADRMTIIMQNIIDNGGEFKLA